MKKKTRPTSRAERTEYSADQWNKKQFTVANKCVKYLTNSNHLCESYVLNIHLYAYMAPDENLNSSIPSAIINVICASNDSCIFLSL